MGIFYLIWFAVSVVVIIIVILLMMQIAAQKTAIEENLFKFSEGNLDLTPNEFSQLRNKSFGGRGHPRYANKLNFSGIYIILNHTKNYYYIGSSQSILNRINDILRGNGNAVIYRNIIAGDNITLKARSLHSGPYNSINHLKQSVEEEYRQNSSFEKFSNNVIGTKSHKKTKINLDTIDKNNGHRPINKGGQTVTQRAFNYKQPHGGFIPVRKFLKTQLDDNFLIEQGNVSPQIMGIAVDYLTRYALGTPPKAAFDISLLGARNLNKENVALKLLDQVDGLSDQSIISAINLARFDVYYRNPMGYREEYTEVIPVHNSIVATRIMVERSVDVLLRHGPLIKTGITFEEGYTNLVSSGDADFLTKDTLWDLKALSYPINKNYTLQLFIYYLMGLKSDNENFANVKFIAIYNPKLNIVYKHKISDIPSDIVSEVRRNVIGYSD